MKARLLYIIFSTFSLIALAQEKSTNELLSQLKSAKSDTNKVLLLNEICKNYIESETKSAHKYSLEMLQLSKELNYLKGIAQAYTNISSCYENEENLKLALKYRLLNYEVNQKRGDPLLIAKSLHNIAWIYECLGDHKTALEYAYKKIKILNDINPPDKETRLEPTYCIMGVMYKNLKLFDSAFYYLSLSETIANKSNNKKALSYTLLNKGMAYEEVKDLLNAEKTYLNGITVGTQIEAFGNLSGMYQGLANIYFIKKDYKKTIEYAKLGLNLANESGDKLFQVYCYDIISKSYYEQQDYKAALFYTDILLGLKDTIASQNNAKELALLRTEFETSEKEKEIQLLEKDKALALATSQKQKAVIVSIIFLLVILVLLIFILVWRFKKNKIQKEIEFAKNKAELEQKALRAQMNPHFLFNSLNSIQRMFIEGKTDAANDVMSDFSNLLRRILNNSGKEKISLKEELDTLELYLQLEKIRSNNAFNYKIEVDENIDQFNTLVPPLIFQPFVENAIWHGLLPSKKQGIVKVQIHRSQNSESLLCEVIDNGVGFSKETTNKHQSKGIQLTEARLTSKVNINSANDQGTTITFTINL